MKEKVSPPDLYERAGGMPQHVTPDHTRRCTELLIETADELRLPDAPEPGSEFLTYSEWVRRMVINSNPDNSTDAEDIPMPKCPCAYLEALIFCK